MRQTLEQRWIATGAGTILVVIAIAGFLLLRDGGDTAVTTTTTMTGPTVTSPYDLTEAGTDFDLHSVGDAKFASVLLETPEGLTSYMVAAGQEPFGALAQAVARATAAQQPAPDTTETLTFVMPDRLTVTFALDSTAGLIAREGSVWRVEGDLDSLVRTITERATPAG